MTHLDDRMCIEKIPPVITNLCDALNAIGFRSTIGSVNWADGDMGLSDKYSEMTVFGKFVMDLYRVRKLQEGGDSW